MIDKTFEKAKEERKAFFQQLAQERRAVFENVDVLVAGFEGTSNSLMNRVDEIASRLLRDTGRELDVLAIILRDLKPPDNIKISLTQSKQAERYGLYRFYGEAQPYRPSGSYPFASIGNGRLRLAHSPVASAPRSPDVADEPG